MTVAKSAAYIKILVSIGTLEQITRKENIAIVSALGKYFSMDISIIYSIKYAWPHDSALGTDPASG